jgi:hypothetical protein
VHHLVDKVAEKLWRIGGFGDVGTLVSDRSYLYSKVMSICGPLFEETM